MSDTKNSKSFLSGRTGDGKTAAIKMIAKNNADCSSEVDLLDMMLNHVSNSDIIRFVSELGADLSLFFQTLWKHVLVIEYIRIKYHIDTTTKSKNWILQFAEFFQNDPTKKRALQYLNDWGSDFWITMDESARQVTETYEKRLQAELGSELEAANAKVGYARNIGREKKANYIHRAQKILHSEQLADLSKVMTALKAYGENTKQRHYYILIDRLDEKWVDDSIRFHLIRALIDTLKNFGKIRDLKVVVAIRVDVLERVINETRDIGFQRDKFEDQSYRIDWTKDRLKSIVNKRINLMCRRTYTKDNVTFEHLFPKQVNGKNAFEYMLDRSFYRPRDLILFTNACLKEAVDNSEVTPTNIKDAERNYSNWMLDSLISEWASVLPSLEILLKKLSNCSVFWHLEDVLNSDFLVDLYAQLEGKKLHVEDSIYCACKAYFENDSLANYHQVVGVIGSELYRVGIIGIKLQSGDRYRFSYKDEPILKATNLTPGTSVQFHQAFHITLNIHPNNKARMRKL